MQDEHQSENQPAEKPAPLGWRAFVLVGFMALVAVALITVGWRIWFSVDTEMDPFAWWLISGALLISVALGGGLTFLLSHSSRHHDHKVYDADHFKKWDRR